MHNLERIGEIVNNIITKQRQPVPPISQPTNQIPTIFWILFGYIISKIFKF